MGINDQHAGQHNPLALVALVVTGLLSCRTSSVLPIAYFTDQPFPFLSDWVRSKNEGNLQR